MKSICKPRFRRWPSWAGDGDFRRRAGSALTHPVTVAALAVLLLNDLLLKALWPQAWLTGKLSDLAWVVFALPLLAFLLTFAVRGSLRARRVAFLAAYVGLPLLYVAFNALDPVHDWIMRGISLAGGAAGSPRDATDSLVIPFAWGAALWVWRREPAAPGAMRLRWAVLVAGVAALASVASQPPDVLNGVQRVGISEDGQIVASVNDNGLHGTHLSTDGGMTWSAVERRGDPTDGVEWGGQSVDTPRGRFALDDTVVQLVSADSRPELAVYSTEHLQRDGNVWVQKVSTENLNELREIATRPLGIVYDDLSGNLVVALGIQGVVIGTRDGEWTSVAVGRFEPTDFSFVGKTLLLLSDFEFWATALALAVSMTVSGIAASQNRLRGMLGAIPIVLPSGIGILGLSGVVPFLTIQAVTSWLLTPLGVIATFIGVGATVFAIGVLPSRSDMGMYFVAAMGVLSVLTSVALLALFGFSNDRERDFSELFFFAFAVCAYVLALPAVLASYHRLKQWWYIFVSFGGMTALVVLVFMLWLHLGTDETLTKVSAVVLCGIAAILLAGYARRSDPVE